MTIEQILYQTYAPVRRGGAFGRVVCILGITALPGGTEAQQVAPPSGEDMTTLRLLAESGPANGQYIAAVEITLAPGAHTYWKNPGEAGVPPVFVFNGSENVAKAEVRFPVPTRISEEGLDAFGYTGRALFPVAVTPVDPAKPATLHADVTYAVCSRICMPAHGEASIRLVPHEPGTAPDLVEAALARVPKPLHDATLLAVVPVAHASPAAWTVTWTGTPALVDVFADTPEGYYFATGKAGPQTWTLRAAQSVAAPGAAEVPVTLVLAGPGFAGETTRTLSLNTRGDGAGEGTP
jgi:DsbC/DsbD-like thiol-disulfide interchange protein